MDVSQARCQAEAMPGPPRSVVQAFGRAGRPLPVVGGEGLAWRVEDVVIKRVHDSAEAAWCQEILAGLVEDGFRRPAPIVAASGQWVVDGWSACRHLEGLREGRPRWREIAQAGVRFHAALAPVDLTTTRVLERRSHRWAVADRVAWHESTADLGTEAQDLCRRVSARMIPLALDVQLIHGDLAGNVLFDSDEIPVVLDFSPYVRPVRYATAIIVVDALLWEGSGPEVLDVLGLDNDGVQLLIRALVFRLVAEQPAESPRHHADLRPYRRVLDQLGL